MLGFRFQLQFVAIMVHAFQLLFIDCNYPRAFVWWIGMHAVLFFFLFNEFYKQSYARKVVNVYLLRRDVCRFMECILIGYEFQNGLKAKLKDAGMVHENGKHYTNGVSNGTVKPMQNGVNHATKVSDYYLNSNDVHLRKLQSADN